MATISLHHYPHYYQWIREEASHPKPVMVFIHGWGGSARYWEKLARNLAPQFDCLLYDLRGFGRSNQGQSDRPYGLEDYAEDLVALLDGLHLDRVFLHSHSLGSSIATVFLNRYGDRVEKAILACNGVFSYNKLVFDLFHWASGYVVKWRYPWFLKVPGLERLFMVRFLHQAIAPEDYRPFLEDFLAATPEAALATIYASVSKEAVEFMPREFAQISRPSLLISGEKDQIIPASMARQAAVLNPCLVYGEIPKTGHFPMLEDPLRYQAIVQDFLGDYPPILNV